MKPEPVSVSRLSTESEQHAPSLRQSNIRQIIPIIIQDSLRVGGRPDSAISEPTDVGEKIEVRTRSSNGGITQQTIEWSVHPDVPEILLVDEREIAKLISAVFLNAVKFTVEGNITLTVKLSKSQKYVCIKCTDTGDGIPEDFQPQLFKPFSREDDSTTRSKEGLGLGLLVAKGLARRLGGDLLLLRSAVSGLQKGSEFEIRVPMEPGVSLSRTGTPLSRTPEPVRQSSSIRPTSTATPHTTSSIMALNRQDVSSPLLPTSPARDNVRNGVQSKFASPPPIRATPPRRISLQNTPNSVFTRPITNLAKSDTIDRNLASKYPLTFLVAEDNKINRKLLVNMLSKLGYKDVYEAFDGREAVRIMADLLHQDKRRRRSVDVTAGVYGGRGGNVKGVDIVLMDLWMPEMDGYEATTEILNMYRSGLPSNADKNGQLRRHSNGAIYDANGFDVNANRATSTAPRIMAVSADVTDEAIEKATRTGMEGFMTKPYRIADLQRLIVDFCVG
jgi:CheY-like chemotaxis protein